MKVKTDRILEVVNLLVLYVGKISGIALSLYFIPLYGRVLGENEFGIVAVIISVQALLVFMDFGMSTLISTELAEARHSRPELAFLVRVADRLLTAFYLLALVPTTIIALYFKGEHFHIIIVFATVGLFAVLVLQNLYYSAMLALQSYVIASLNQTIGSIARASASALTLVFISPDLEGFIWSQLIVGSVQFFITKSLFKLKFTPLNGTVGQLVTFRVVYSVLLKGLPFMTLSVAGALVLQLDKPLILAFMTPSAVAPYFLAMTLCMSPVSMLGAPVTQYFQPKLLNQFAHGSFAAQKVILQRYTLTITTVIFIPFLLFWNFRATLVNLWLDESKYASLVLEYTEILMPAIAVGALGFIPYSLLLAGRQYRFQATFSAILTVITLTAVTIAAITRDVVIICYIYAFYHTSSTLISWLRTMNVTSTKTLGVLSFLTSLVGTVIVLAIQFLINVF